MFPRPRTNLLLLNSSSAASASTLTETLRWPPMTAIKTMWTSREKTKPPPKDTMNLLFLIKTYFGELSSNSHPRGRHTRESSLLGISSLSRSFFLQPPTVLQVSPNPWHRNAYRRVSGHRGTELKSTFWTPLRPRHPTPPQPLHSRH